MALQSITALASITLREATASVSFSGIPQNYRDLVIIVDGTNAGFANVILRFNGDTGSNYSNVLMRAGNPPATASEAFTDSYAYIGQFGTSTSNTIIQIIDYSATDKHKAVLGRGNVASNGIGAFAARWANTLAITNVLIEGGTFQAGTTVNLYGRIA